MKNFNKMNQHDLISILWLLCHLHSSKFFSLPNNKGMKHKHKSPKFHKSYDNKPPTHLRGVASRLNKHSRSPTHKRVKCTKKSYQRAFISQHDLSARNKFPAIDLEKGWIIDSGASAHMTPFKNDCTNIQPTYKMIYLADGSTVLCKQMGNISIPISKNKKVLGSLILEDVLIVPNLDRRLFSVNAFLSKGHNWVHFSRHTIKLGIKDGPSINIPISSLQSNALVVDHSGIQQSKDFATLPVSLQQLTATKKKTNLDTGLLHARLHRPDGVLQPLEPMTCGGMLT